MVVVVAGLQFAVDEDATAVAAVELKTDGLAGGRLALDGFGMVTSPASQRNLLSSVHLSPGLMLGASGGMTSGREDAALFPQDLPLGPGRRGQQRRAPHTTVAKT